MERLLEGMASPTMKSRISAVEDLRTYLERLEIVDRDEAAALCETVAKSLKDANYKVCAGALAAMASAVLGAPDQFRGGMLQNILPGTFDRLGDAKAPVRDAGRELLLALMSSGAAAPAELVGEASPAWRHKNWRVREETLRVVERAFAELDREMEAGQLDMPVKAVVAVAARALEDREPAVREAAICALVAADAAVAAAGGDVLRLLEKHTVRPGQMKEIQTRLRGEEPTHVTKRVASPVLSAARAASAPRAFGGDRSSTSGSAGTASGLSGSRRTTGNGSSASSGGATPGVASSLRRAGSLGSREAVPSASRAHATSLLSRPATTAGGERQVARSLSGGVALADPDDLPPYGRATGVVPRIAEGVPPRAAHVDSDRELSAEIDRVAERLDPKHEWTDRMNAMTRVEALLLGGAAEWDAFPAQLAKLRGPLTAQVADRRSSIVRQAAHLLVILSAELGGEFEKEAAHFVPELFKCVVITVQIIAESGDHGIRGVLHNCQARQLVPRLCEAASKDRSVKLRCHATGWLRLVAKEWDSLGGARNQECLEEALQAMVADGSPDVRAGARKLFSTYGARYPDGAARVAGRLDANTKRLIAQEVASGAHEDGDDARAEAALLARRPRAAATKTRLGDETTYPPERPSAAASGGRRAGAVGVVPSATGARTRAGPGPGPGPGPGGSASRSLGGEEGSGRRAPATTARDFGASRDVSSMPASRDASSARRARERSASPEMAPGETRARAQTVSAALDAVLALGARGSGLRGAARRAGAAPASWEAKSSAFDALAGALRAGGRRGAEEASSRARELADALVAHLGDPHHRVAHAALEAAVEAVPATGRALEPELERLCPPMFPRLVDAKESVRDSASAALAAVGDAFPADAILPSMLVSLEAAKAPRAKTGVLEFALYVLSGRGGGTRPDALATASPASAGSLALRKWVARVTPLVSDRHAPLRAAAAAGLAAVHVRTDPECVLKHLAAMPPGEAAVTCRAVAQHAPAVEREFHAYVAAERRAAERAAAAAEAGAEAAYAAGRARAASSEPGSEPGSLSAGEPVGEARGEAAVAAESGSFVDAHRRVEEKALVEKARRVREARRRDEEEARRSVADAREAEDARVAAERIETERLVAANGFSGFDSDASVSDGDVEIENPPETDAEETARSAVARLSLETESAGMRAYRESRAAADTSAERMAAASATLASVRRALRGGATVTAEEARAAVAAASHALGRAAATPAEPDPSAETKTHALVTLRDLARCSPEALAPHAPAALAVILDALEDAEGTERDPETALGAGDALDGVVDVIAPEVALRALAPRLALEPPAAARLGVAAGTRVPSAFSAAPVRCVGGVVARMPAEALRGAAPDILPGLVEAFNSTSADVRKAVVDALVAMHDTLGDWLLARLGGLTAAQQKLLTIYIDRAAERRGKRGGDRGEFGALGKNGASAGRVPLAPRPAQ